jgi:hypothetical protein
VKMVIIGILLHILELDLMFLLARFGLTSAH